MMTPNDNLNDLRLATCNITSLTTERMHTLPLYLSTNNIDILCLQETKIDQHDLDYLKFKLPHMEILGSIGTNRSRGVLLLAKRSSAEMEGLSFDAPNDEENEGTFVLEQGRIVGARLKFGRLYFTLINIYAPVDKQARAAFFALLSDRMSTLEGPFVLMGDFNCILYPQDALPQRNPNLDSSTSALQKIINDYDLDDAHYNCDVYPFYTYSGHSSSSRLDRVYISSSLRPRVDNATVIPSIGSHHPLAPALTLRNPEDIETGKGIWRMQALLIQHPLVRTSVDRITECIDGSFDGNPLDVWLWMKKLLRASLQKCSRRILGRRTHKKARLERKFKKKTREAQEDNSKRTEFLTAQSDYL